MIPVRDLFDNHLTIIDPKRLPIAFRGISRTCKKRRAPRVEMENCDEK